MRIGAGPARSGRCRRGGAGADAQVHATLELLIQLQSRVFAFADAHWFFLAMFLACIPIVWLARPPFHAQGGGMPH
ncbi:MAG: hypothetical protein AB7Q97_12600 [Gammaproteobacteria bacterium]